MEKMQQIKTKNEEIIIEYLSKAFGEGYELKVNWGYPITQVQIDFKNEEVNNNIVISMNLNNEDFQISIQGTRTEKKEDSEEVIIMPNPVTIDKKTIDFVIRTVAGITEQLFVTRPQDEENTEDPEIKEE